MIRQHKKQSSKSCLHLMPTDEAQSIDEQQVRDSLADLMEVPRDATPSEMQQIKERREELRDTDKDILITDVPPAFMKAFSGLKNKAMDDNFISEKVTSTCNKCSTATEHTAKRFINIFVTNGTKERPSNNLESQLVDDQVDKRSRQCRKCKKRTVHTRTTTCVNKGARHIIVQEG